MIEVQKFRKGRPVFEKWYEIDSHGRIIGTHLGFLYFRFNVSESRTSIAQPATVFKRNTAPRHNRRGWTARSY